MNININTTEKSRTARSDKNTNSCPKTFSKTATGYIFYHTSKVSRANKKDIKFTVDGNAFQTFITLSTKNFRVPIPGQL